MTLSTPPVSSAAAQRPCLLVVEDTDDIRFFLAALLQDQYQVLAAASGTDGLHLAAHSPRPDLILLDVLMPDMDGYEVLQRLRQDSRTADIPVIFLTALSSAQEEQRGLDMGAIDYVTKPISPPILLARIKVHLERSANARRLKNLSEQLSRYLAPQVYQSLFDGSRQAEIRTQRKQLTVFFSDICNFTAFTAQWQPEEVTLLLNSYFEEMSQIAAEFGATLDKFVGDAILIFFGDPHTLGVREDALQCVRMALAMQARMPVLHARWRSQGIHRHFEIRMGIHSGFCDVGNFGSHLRMDYTIIGREVNLAARLEQAAAPGEILISRETHALVQHDMATEAREPVMVKGFADPIASHVVRGLSTQMPVPAARHIHCDQPGLHMALDVASLTPAQRTVATAALRQALAALEMTVPATVAASPTEPASSSTRPHGSADWLVGLGGLDTTLGLARAMGARKLYLGMLRRFVANRSDTVSLVRQALDADDLAGAERLVHSLKGVAAQIAAHGVPGDAQALELAIHEAQPRAVLDGLLAQLELSLNALLAALASGLPPAHVLD